MTTKGNLRIVGAAVDKALPAPRVGRKAPAGSRRDEPELPMLPAGCPVKPLGKLGQVCFYLDEGGQMISLDPQKHGKTHIRNLFGRKSKLCDAYWPRYSDKKDPQTGELRITGWRPEDAADMLMNACAHAGIFDPQGRVRGRGAHRGTDGLLILHCGDQVMVAGGDAGTVPTWSDAGLIDGYVYATAPKMPRPDPAPAAMEDAEELLALIRTWRWARPAIDPILLLGGIAAGMIGGALAWRPHIWMTGDTSTGKSTLQKLLELLLDGGALHTHDATEASLRQLLKQQTLPVFFDELEAEEDGRRGAAVIKLARLASSGGVIFRGGQDHQGHEFVAKSCFFFSSILMPAMLTQDRNRLAVLDLEPFPQGSVAPAIGDKGLPALGRKLRRRLVDGWPRFDATLTAYRKALSAEGHGGRSQDQFGTLLACADLLLYDYEPTADLLADWAEQLSAATLAEKADDRSDAQEAAQFLATSMMQGKGGDEPMPVSRYIARAAMAEGGESARERLENHGLRLVNHRLTPSEQNGFCDPVPGEPLYVAIANSHEGLARIFRDTRWASRSGQNGVWAQTFGRTAGAYRRVKVRFAGASIHANLVPIAALVARGPEGDE